MPGARAAMLLVEGTAGAGGQLGRTPAELARARSSLASVRWAATRQVGTCLDSAHLWGAGYDLWGTAGSESSTSLREHWGREVPHLLHGNDTQVELGSRRDRHAPPGEGRLGERFFRTLLVDSRCASLPIVLEIPPGEGNEFVRASLARLRSWASG